MTTPIRTAFTGEAKSGHFSGGLPQWRIAVSWMCGYFIFQLFVPVLFAYRGPLEAGQMGISLSISNVLASVAISWVNTKAARLAA